MVQSWLWALVSLVIAAASVADVGNEIEMRSTNNAIQAANQRDSMALIAIYNATGGPFWTRKWDVDQPIDNWFGVTTNANGDVIELDLSNNNLFGNLPTEMSFLSELTILKLGFNDLRGNLPRSVGSMIKLQEIFLFENALDLPIPDTIVNLKQLKILSLASNNIPGEIPRRIGQMTNLEMLVLDGNDLSGEIPPSIGQLSQLIFLDIHNNDLEGAIPPSIGQLNHLREFLMYDNELTDTIPHSVLNMDSLQFFWVHNNRLEGAVPPFDNPKLRSIRLEYNQLDYLPNLTSLSSLGVGFPDGLSLEYNQMSFDDIIENFALRSTSRFSYRPQDSLMDANLVFYANKGDRLEIKLPFDDTISTSKYRWFKDGGLEQLTDVNSMVIAVVDDSDEGRYYAEASNPNVGDLKLVTHTFQIVVRDSADCDSPEAGSSCVDAPLFCHTSDLDLYCGSLPPSFDTVLCQEISLTAETMWLGFTTDSTIPTIQILPYSCSNQSAGVQVAIYRRCQGKELVYCSPGCSQLDLEIELSNAQPNEAYYIAIRSCGGQCKYQVRAFSDGDPIALELNGPIVGQDTICGVDNLIKYQLPNAPSSAQRFHWLVNEDTVETVLPEIDVIWGTQGTRQLCVKAISECGESEWICKSIAVFPGLEIESVLTEVVRNDSFYVLSFKVVGGVRPITVDGISGIYNALDKTFISDLIRCGTPYTVKVTDKNECEEVLSGVEVCNCSSDAGELLMASAETCGDEEVDVGPRFGSRPDSNDVGGYVLLEQPLFDRTKILAYSQNSRFSAVEDTLEFDQMYYAFYLVGNDDGSGNPSLSDPCLDASNGRPVIFHSAPQANAGRDTFHCERNFSIRAIKSKVGSSGLWSQLAGPSVAFIDDDKSAITVVRTAAEGNYIFTWREDFQGCSDTDTVEVLVRTTIEGQIVGPDSLCSGESATLLLDRTFNDYLWDGGEKTPSIRIPGPGEYCVRVFTADGCTRRFCKKVEETSIEPPEIMGKNTLCPGDMETIQVVPNYESYAWSTGDSVFFISVDSAGLYCITVTDFNGCTATDCIVVAEGEDRVNNIQDTLCHGDTITVFGEDFYESGTFQVKNSDGKACDSIVNLNLFFNPEIFISDSLIIRDDGTGIGAISVNIKGGSPPYDYLWDNGATIPFINNLDGGFYTLTVTDQMNCQQTFVFDVRQPNSVHNIQDLGLSIGPNPLNKNDKLWMFGGQNVGALNVELFNSSGQMVEKCIINLDNTSKSGFIPISHTLEGVYLLKATDQKGRSQWFKLVISL